MQENRAGPRLPYLQTFGERQAGRAVFGLCGGDCGVEGQGMIAGNTKAARTEHVEAVALMRVVRLHEAKHPQLRMLFAVPNGGARSKIVAAKLKAEGVRPGVPDYLLPVPSHGYLGLAVELKSMTGYASKEQKQWISDLREAGWKAEVCRGWEQAWAVVRGYVENPRQEI